MPDSGGMHLVEFLSGQENSEFGELELFQASENTKLSAIGIILAALYGVSTLVPISAFLGAAGSISLTICLAPLFGILLGPSKGFGFGLVAGVLQAFLSVFVFNISLVVPTVIFGPAVSGLFTGLALQKKATVGDSSFPGPTVTAAYLFVIVLLYLIPNSSTWWFMSLYIVAAVTALALQTADITFDWSKKGWRKYLQILPFTLIGTMTDFSMMTMGAVYILSLPADLFGYVIFPLMLSERITAVIISSILSAVVLTAFPDVWET
ncbi:hypothetical protein EU538_09825 [Candidatus Thorarchaeota archaeon]|nr:MAG: hypothetical protein EU538_09825 [Candidatus Thorarchaeota archaeon]